MCRKVQIFISSLLFFFSISTANSQKIISRLTNNANVHIALKKFETPLLIELKIPKGETSVNLKVSFPEGISYSKIEIPQQEKNLIKVEKTMTSTESQPIFIVTAKPESVVSFWVYKKISKQIKAKIGRAHV